MANRADGHAVMVADNDKAIPVSKTITGFLDGIDISGSNMEFVGWAADVANSRSAKTVHLFLNEKMVHTSPVATPRTDVAKHFNDGALVKRETPQLCWGGTQSLTVPGVS